jgi:alpha-glucosidase
MAAASTNTQNNGHEWWQSGVVYQIYPRSFQDTNGDGVGDLPGVIQRLDYLKWLGVDAVWLSPIYPSPMADFGYDISDYCNIHPLFGTLTDFDRLVSEAHARGLKVILDFVPNHTSDRHPWFLESKSSRTSAKRDWYIWRDPAPGGGPPNNWLSNFGGPAWRLDESTGQYYFHAFLAQQPDINWRNPEVQAAMHDVLRFWLDRGVDGFRVDVIYHIVKDDQFRDNPRNPHYKAGQQNPHHEFLATYIADRPEVHDIIAGMRRVIDEYQNRMLVGEIYLPVERLVMYYGEGGQGVHMPFNFQLITMPWNARTISDAIQHYERSLPTYGWPNWVLGNHDNSRIASRVGRAQARVAAMMLLTLRGTPTMYYGDEIGMCDVPIPKDRVQDPFEKNVPGMGLGRDPERTPMQWDASPGAGFTSAGVEPWLPLADDRKDCNVAAERDARGSFLALYRALIDLRRKEPALHVGAYAPVSLPDDVGELIAYVRHHDGGRFLVVLNLSDRPQTFAPADASTLPGAARIVLSTHLDRAGEPLAGRLALRADEGVVVDVSASKTD